jgi:hypothetical protein
MNPYNEQLAELISVVSESLHREMESLRRESREGFTRVNERLDLMGTRLDRHGASND